MRANQIHENLEATLSKFDDAVGNVKERAGGAVNTVKERAGGIDLQQQMAERPWMMLGAAVAVGYVLGSAFGGSDDSSEMHKHHSSSQMHTHDFAGRYQDMSSHGSAMHNQYSSMNPPSGNYSSYSSTPMYENRPATTGDFASRHNSDLNSVGVTHSYSPSHQQHGQQGNYSPSHQQYGQQGNYSPSMQPYNQSSQAQHAQQSKVGAFTSQFSGEIDTIKNAAVMTIRSFIRDTVRDAVPSMRAQVDELDRRDGRNPSSSSQGSASSFSGASGSSSSTSSPSGSSSSMSSPSGSSSSDAGMADPTANRGYVRTYHSPESSNEAR
jgi:hypothetical protein